MKRFWDIAKEGWVHLATCCKIAPHHPSKVVFGLGIEGDKLGTNFQNGNGIKIIASYFYSQGIDSHPAPSGEAMDLLLSALFIEDLK